jgi:cell division protein FtsW (lipid II flippase)
VTKRRHTDDDTDTQFAGYEHCVVRVLLLLLGFGLVMASDLAYYSTSQEMGSSYFIVIRKFLLAVIVGAVAALLMRKASAKSLFNLGITMMLVSIGLLIYTHTNGVEVYGARRWVDIFGFRFQPVEPFKIALAFGLATIFSKGIEEVSHRTHAMSRLFYLVSSLSGLALIFLQPNHSAVLTIFIVVVLVSLLSWLKWQKILPVVTILTIAVSILILRDPEKLQRIQAWLFLNYMFVLITFIVVVSIALFSWFKWKTALSIFLLLTIAISVLIWQNPEKMQGIRDWLEAYRNKISLQDERFQVNRSLEAMSIGKWTGNGIGKSIIKYSLPAASTDFVFAIVVEEFGFIGGIILLLCYLYLINITFSVTASQKDEFLRLSSLGVILFFTFNVVLHIAVNLGIIPTTGVPLPFISQGGSALTFHLMSMGLILNLAYRKDTSVSEE